jgi:protein-disulfide isomerase
MPSNARRSNLLVAGTVALLGATAALVAVDAGLSRPARALAALPSQAAAAVPTPPLPPDEEQRFAAAWAQQPRTNFGIAAGGAKVVIVKFNDYLCGACRVWHEQYHPIIEKHQKESPGSIKLVLKDWPWNNRCNFRSPSTLVGHEAACEAAAAVRMARDRGREHDMETWLWAEQSKLIDMRTKGQTAAADAIKAKVTALLALKPGDFERDYSTRLLAIRQDVADGVALSVDSTPIYYVNGVKTTQPGGNLPPQYFDAALRIELMKAGR